MICHFVLLQHQDKDAHFVQVTDYVKQVRTVRLAYQKPLLGQTKRIYTVIKIQLLREKYLNHRLVPNVFGNANEDARIILLFQPML
jgi:hypothetical protein